MQRVAIIGLGLIGGSIGLGLKRWSAEQGKGSDQALEIIGGLVVIGMVLLAEVNEGNAASVKIGMIAGHRPIFLPIAAVVTEFYGHANLRNRKPGVQIRIS